MHGPHCHHQHAATYNRAFAIGIALNVGYVALEAGYGFAVNSLSLLADAGHNLSDVLGLLLAWGAHYLSQSRPTDRRTYGWRSSSILAALVNACVLLAAVGAIAWEAIRRFGSPQTVPGNVVVWVAGIGVVVNTVTALLFIKGRREDLNIQGAFLHMAADAGVSVAVVIGGWSIMATEQRWIDPALSLLVVAVIVWGTWGLLRDSTNLALHAVPKGIDPGRVRQFLLERPGVEAIHDLHIWAMSTTETALTAHLIRPEADDNDRFLAETSAELHEQFGIQHATLQLERELHAELCRQAPEGTL
jgi:cobalt-zinc-cadmium efflux system protein